MAAATCGNGKFEAVALAFRIPAGEDKRSVVGAADDGADPPHHRPFLIGSEEFPFTFIFTHFDTPIL